MSLEASTRARSGRAIALSFAWLVVPIAACSHRVDEPTPDPPSANHAPDATAEGAASPPPKPAKRCIMPTPDKPVREVVGVVPDPQCPADPEGNPKLAVSVVRFPEAPGAVEAAVEIADKDKDRMRGLMYRKAMGADAGMLFVFDEEQVLRFWMKNTCIPLDMIFIAEDGTIVGIEENTPTLSEDTFTANCPAKYVLEMNAGWSRKHGIKAGQKASIVR